MDTGTATGILVGIVTGTMGSTLGVLNYIRDRTRVAVNLQLGMREFPGDKEVKHLLITIANIGRRPVFLSHVHLVSPEGVVLHTDSLSGVKLDEGDKPTFYKLTHDNLHQTFSNLQQIRAVAVDSAGKLYCSWLESEKIGRFGPLRHWWNCRRNRIYPPPDQNSAHKE